MKKFIAFVDLLASKSSALIGSEEFYDSIKEFHRTLLVNKVELRSGCKLRHFADCCYIEADSAEELFIYFQTVRNTLFGDRKYFKASIGVGELSDLPVRDSFPNLEIADDVEGVMFGEDVVPVYLNIEAFKGIGVFIDSSVVKELRRRKMYNVIDQYIIGSAFFPDEKALELQHFSDLRLTKSEVTRGGSSFAKVLESMGEAKARKKKYLRYYFPMIMLWINCAPFEDIAITKDAEGKMRFTDSIFTDYFFKAATFSARFGDIPQYGAIFFAIMKRFVDAGLPDEALKFLVKALPAPRKIFNEVDQIPSFVIPHKDKTHLLRLYAHMT